MTDQQSNRPVSELLEPLKIALALECEGRKFFTDTAARLKNTLARQTLEFLAKEESKHIERIQEFYSSIEQSGGRIIPRVDPSDADRRLGEFNDRLALLKDTLPPTATDVEAYRMALKFENGAEELYQRQLEESRDPNVQAFYRWLIHEETMHSKVLNSCIKFIEDPTGWFRERGK